LSTLDVPRKSGLDSWKKVFSVQQMSESKKLKNLLARKSQPSRSDKQKQRNAKEPLGKPLASSTPNKPPLKSLANARPTLPSPAAIRIGNPPNLHTMPTFTPIPQPPQRPVGQKKQLFLPRLHNPETFGGLDVDKIAQLNVTPLPITTGEFGKVELSRVALGLQSGLTSEVHHCLELLVVLSADAENLLVVKDMPSVMQALFRVVFDALCALTMVWEEQHQGELVYSMQQLYKSTVCLPFPELAYQALHDVQQLQKVYGPRLSIDLVEMTKHRIVAALTILRNLSFSPKNADLAHEGKLLQLVLYFFSMIPMHCHAVCESVWTSVFLLDCTKHVVVLLANLGAEFQLRNAAIATRIMTALSGFITPNMTQYRHVALEASARLMLASQNQDIISQVSQECLSDFVDNLVSALLGQSTQSSEDMALLQLVLINLSTLVASSPEMLVRVAETENVLAMLIHLCHVPESSADWINLSQRAASLLRDLATPEKVSEHEDELVKLLITLKTPPVVERTIQQLLKLSENQPESEQWSK